MSVCGHTIVKKLQSNDHSIYVINTGSGDRVLKHFQDDKSFEAESCYVKLLENYNIMPKVLSVDDDNRIIISQKMNPLVDEDGFLINKNVLTPTFIDQLDMKISLLHSLGIAHGDLSSHNIIYNNDGEPFIIDFEKAYKINEYSLETKEWMVEFFDWEDSYADFVNFDYINWRKFLLLPCDKAPRDFVDPELEYLYGIFENNY
jgi:predicted Ser/Thr protein kinase